MKRLWLIPLLLIAGCISSHSQSGVVNKWRDQTLPAIEPGTTTRTDIARALGPPSQLIDLGDELVFYYLSEQDTSKGLHPHHL